VIGAPVMHVQMPVYPPIQPLYEHARPSMIRRLQPLAAKPDVVSFAGGWPSVDLLPDQQLAKAIASVFARRANAAFQYGATEGDAQARKAIGAYFADVVADQSTHEWLLTTGSQQAIDLIARVVLAPGDVVAVEEHAYPAALQCFRFCGARIVSVASDAHGMLPEALQAACALHKLKIIYLVPSFANPSAHMMPTQRRLDILRVLRDTPTLIMEDDPYRFLGFDGGCPPSLHRLAAQHGLNVNIAYLTSFSKVLAPNVRVGAAFLAPGLHRAVKVAKQAADIHSCTLGQEAVADLICTDWFATHLLNIQQAYQRQAQHIESALRAHCPMLQWKSPAGGMFLWAQLPRALSTDSQAWFDAMDKHRVLVIPGTEFRADESASDRIRLSFSTANEESCLRGAQRLAAMLSDLKV
jgi:2-aminoadipate transaminase